MEEHPAGIKVEYWCAGKDVHIHCIRGGVQAA